MVNAQKQTEEKDTHSVKKKKKKEENTKKTMQETAK